MRSKIKLVWTGASVLASALVVMGTSASAQGTGPLKVGLLQSLSGPVAPYGISGKAGIELAAKEINEKGGIAGRQIELVVADTQGNPSAAVSELNRLIQREKIEVTLSPLLSVEQLAIQPILKQAKIVGIGVSNADQLTPQVAPFGFMAFPSAGGTAKAMAAYSSKIVANVKKAALIGDSNAGSKLGMQLLKKELTDRGIEVTGIQEYQSASTDVVPQLLDLKRGNPDILFQFAALGQDTAAVIKGLQDTKWDIKVVSTVAGGMTGDAAVKMVGADALGNLTALNFKSFTYCPSDKEPSPAEGFIVRLDKNSPDLVGKLFYPQASLYYDALYLIKAAIEGSGGKTDGQSIVDWIETKSAGFKGVTIGSEATKDNHFLVGLKDIAPVKIEKVKNGRFQERADCT